ncbi:glycosyltransferase [Mycolicibacterium vanbaalenii]|uniref:glycosyltransferase n=1 Tax=Mycolicibacterium vanbaalenii TaxID=110539 RepID=UPI001F26C7FD|nr:glycosyltransferase [Mycolicibacterium vanbaalenii]UJL31495.1 glycosyltransferase [Mycolicibacterium vanbaalenii]WND58343.1 glycosyltransferase [Mycolicibacterium vanbaalenii]
MLVLSDFTFPSTEGLHKQALLHARYMADTYDLCLIIFCKDADNVDIDGLSKELRLSNPIVLISYTGSMLTRGYRNFILGNACSQSRAVVTTVRSFSPEFIHLYGYAVAGLHRHFRHIPGVISWVDAASRRQFRLARVSVRRSFKHSVAGLAYLAYEVLCRSRNKVWHVVSDVDKRFLARVHPTQACIQIPVVVEALTSSAPRSSDVMQQSRADIVEGGNGRELNAVIFADLRVDYLYESFTQLVHHCLLPLHGELPSIRYLVLGRVDEDEKLRRLCFGLNIDFISWVDDLDAALSKADIVILPDQVGTGLKNRAITALAAGCVVLGSDFAFEGISITPGHHAVIARSQSEWRAGIRALANDSRMRQSLREAAADATKEFDPQLVFARWSNTYLEISKRHLL